MYSWARYANPSLLSPEYSPGSDDNSPSKTLFATSIDCLFLSSNCCVSICAQKTFWTAIVKIMITAFLKHCTIELHPAKNEAMRECLPHMPPVFQKKRIYHKTDINNQFSSPKMVRQAFASFMQKQSNRHPSLKKLTQLQAHKSGHESSQHPLAKIKTV